MACTCAPRQEISTGRSEPDLGWLFLEKGPYTLSTHVDAAPGEASLVLVKDVSLMAPSPDTVLAATVTVKADSTLEAALGNLEPGFYQVRLRDSLRWNIGIRPEAVVSAPDAPKDFGAFWQDALKELDQVPLEPEYTVVEDFSNHLRTCPPWTAPSPEVSSPSPTPPASTPSASSTWAMGRSPITLTHPPTRSASIFW